ncbi:MAG: hypothetical protein KJ626_03935 [Verrucomicrobia bacterium]|nr:hypothetical protein [Verrucomicrobiota bacterium]
MDSSHDEFDFWYAVNNTEVLMMPSRRLETFGSTVVNYHLVSQLMDSIDKIRIREGRIQAHRPEIITPRMIADELLEGFGKEAHEYFEWLKGHENSLYLLKYGFAIRKSEMNEHTVTDEMGNVLERVTDAVREKDDPLSAIVVGVDEPWEVCLMKLMVEVVQASVEGNLTEYQQKQALSLKKTPATLREQVEQAFAAAAKDAGKVDALAQLLKQRGLFEKYQDRFFALVKSHRR